MLLDMLLELGVDDVIVARTDSEGASLTQKFQLVKSLEI
jgi:isocitrate lyase